MTDTGRDVGLHARTVPLDYGPDPLQFDGSPTVLFDRPGLTLVGWGTAQLVSASNAADVLASIPCEDDVRCPGSGVVALGSLPYDRAMEGLLVIPRFAMGISRDADGMTRRWATAVGPSDDRLPQTTELFDAVIWQYGTTETDMSDDEPLGVTSSSTSLTSDQYRGIVTRAVDTMRAPGAALRKVVLSRPVTVRLDHELDLAAALRRLRGREPNGTIFSMQVPDGTFFGASPELLVSRHGDRVTCHPLAGTIARGATARADADAQGRLAGSDKDRAEHAYVVDAIADVLRPLCRRLDVPKEPSLVAFTTVAHLGTHITGALRSDVPVDALGLVRRLHPTPAVGGSPRDDAAQMIEALEPTPRGHWAGPVGWTDARGDGEWMIGIRSALLHGEGNAVTFRAGSGIVADSEPEAETAETNMKLSTVMRSVLAGTSVTLS
jgi:menaquinone-specific isochorismate synthase